MEIENISASDLIKRSAKQLVYLRLKKEKIHNWMMERGVEYQHKVVKDESLQNTVTEELRGCYPYKNYNIFFCIDMLKDSAFYEIKSIFDEEGNPTLVYDDWYLNQSILQCAFYKSLIMKMPSTILYTPKFRIKEGYKKISVDVKREWPYYLMFGEVGVYEVQVLDPDSIIDFYINKIESLGDYTSAGCFDSKYKWKEFDELKNYFVVNKIL